MINGTRQVDLYTCAEGPASEWRLPYQGVRGAPFAVGGCFGGVGDLGVDVQLHVAVARGVLEPVRYGQVGFVPLAGFTAVDAGVVGAGAGVADRSEERRVGKEGRSRWSP